MNYSICLDQFSTNFNIANLSSNGFSIYTNLDNFTNPISQNIPYQDLFAPPIGNCPYVVNLPQGATQLVVIDACTSMPNNVASIFATGSNSVNNLTTTCCYAVIDVPAQPVSWCDTSGLTFDVFSSSFIGQIVAGNLISNIGTVTDYKIGWYKNGNYSNPEFTSGYGNAFTPYQLTHPLTGTSSPMVTAGNWEGIILDIAINGTTYSSVSGSANGTPIPFESCFDTVVVEPFQCGNGTFSLPYTHQKSFTAAGNGTPPPVISTTYQLNSSTDYFAYKFEGYNVWDELEIKFISGNPNGTGDPTLYSQPIYLEKAQIGLDILNSSISTIAEITNNIYPKKVKLSEFKKVLTLTNISRSANPSLPDYLDIKVTPNPTNNQTSWKLQMQCLDTFSCEDCLTPFPAIKISNIFLDRLCCGTQQPIVTYSGSCDCGTDIWYQRKITNNPSTYSEGYTLGWSSLANNFISSSNTQLIQTNPFSSNTTPSCASPGNSLGIITCSPVTTDSIINYHKSTTVVNGNPQGIISMSFNNSIDYLHYKNQLIAQETSLTQNIGPITFNPTLPEYYSYYILAIPTTNISCGDGVPLTSYNIHRTAYPNITYIEDVLNNYWSITIPMPTIVNNIPIVSCSSCYNNVDGVVNMVNYSSTTTPTLNVTNTYGSKFLNPWGNSYTFTFTPSIPTTVISYIGAWQRTMPYYSWNTLPFVSSSNGWVNLPTLEANPCPTLISSSMPYGQQVYWNNTVNSGFYNYGQEAGFLMYFPNSTGSSDWFQIYTFVSSSNGNSLNPNTPTPGQMIYQYSASIGTVYSSSYFVNGAPTVTIDPWPNC
jgi:hypothetical protein